MTNDALDKIRKLLALAADASAAPGEVEAALGRAAHLQRLHGLTDETIRNHVSGANEKDVRIDARAVVDRVVMRASKLGRWDAWTAGAVAKAALCGCYFGHDYAGRTVHFYGLPADVAVGEALFAFALQAGERSAAEYCKREALQRRSRDANAYRDGFCGGLYKAAEKALADAQSDVTTVPVMQAPRASVDEQAPAMALALVPSRAVVAATLTALATFKGTLNLSKRRGYRGSSGGSDHYGAGRAAGASTSLTRRAL